MLYALRKITYYTSVLWLLSPFIFVLSSWQTTTQLPHAIYEGGGGLGWLNDDDIYYIPTFIYMLNLYLQPTDP